MANTAFWPMNIGQRGEKEMTTVANSRPITPEQYFEAVELVTSQMVDGDSEDVKLAVSNFLNAGDDDIFSLSPDMIPLYRIAAILKAVSEGKEKDDMEIDPRLLFSLSEEALKRFYPDITEPGLEGLAWKPELIFKSPAYDSDYCPNFIDSVRYLSSALERGNPLGLDVSFTLLPHGQPPCTLRIRVVPKQD